MQSNLNLIHTAMNTLQLKKPHALLFVLSIVFSFTLNAQGGWNPERLKESKKP